MNLRYFNILFKFRILCGYVFYFQAEVKDLKKQLKRVEDDMKRSQTDSSKYYTILKDIYSKVHPAVNAPTSPSPKDKGDSGSTPSVKNEPGSGTTPKNETGSSGVKKEENALDSAAVNGKSEAEDSKKV